MCLYKVGERENTSAASHAAFFCLRPFILAQDVTAHAIRSRLPVDLWLVFCGAGAGQKVNYIYLLSSRDESGWSTSCQSVSETD